MKDVFEGYLAALSCTRKKYKIFLMASNNELYNNNTSNIKTRELKIY